MKNSPLISAADLNAILQNPKVKIFDIRGIWGENPRSLYEDYQAGHIPNAVFLDWRKEFIEQNKIPSLAQVSNYDEAKKSFEELGIDLNDHVILYDDYHHMFAGRTWWAMRYWGFTNVSVLNGGFQNWKSQGLPISQKIPNISKGTYEPEINSELRIPMDRFLIEKDESCLLDGRGIVGYNGKPDDPRTGHIPGAISAAYNTLLDKETGLFLKEEELVNLFNETIPNWQNQRIISSCGAGYSGTVVMLALASLGINSTLFDESFSVWKLDPSRPVVQSN